MNINDLSIEALEICKFFPKNIYYNVSDKHSLKILSPISISSLEIFSGGIIRSFSFAVNIRNPFSTHLYCNIVGVFGKNLSMTVRTAMKFGSVNSIVFTYIHSLNPEQYLNCYNPGYTRNDPLPRMLQY